MCCGVVSLSFALLCCGKLAESWAGCKFLFDVEPRLDSTFFLRVYLPVWVNREHGPFVGDGWYTFLCLTGSARMESVARDNANKAVPLMRHTEPFGHGRPYRRLLHGVLAARDLLEKAWLNGPEYLVCADPEVL